MKKVLSIILSILGVILILGSLKIIDLNNSIKKRDITNADLKQKIEDESKLNKTLRAEIENKNLKIDSLDDLIRQQYTKEYSGLIPNNFFGCWGKCGGTMDGDWITISKNKTGHIIIERYECGGSVEEIFKVQGTEKFVFLYSEGCEGVFMGYSAALISATNRSISITEIPRVDFEFFLKKNSPNMMILDTEEGYQMNKDILNLFNSKGNKRWYNYSKYANGYGGDNEIDQDTEMDLYEQEDDEPEETNEVFEIFDVSEKASFPGGDAGFQRFIAENITFPPMALENDIQGTVNVMFVVDKTGKVKDVAILGRKRGFGLEDEAIRVIKMTSGRWIPAKQRDKSVNMRFRIPVKFQIF